MSTRPDNSPPAAGAMGIPPVEGAAAGAGVLTADTPCLHCGYNLRTLTLDAPCPECATPVRASAAGRDLCFAPPDYVSRLARGAELLHSAAICVWTGAAISLVGHLFACAGIGVLLIAALLATAGVFLFTTPDPRPFVRQQHAALRRTLRSALLWIPAPLVAAASLDVFPPRFSWLEEALIAATLLLLIGAFPLAFLAYVRSVLVRVPAPELIRSLNGLHRLTAIAVSSLLLAIGLFYIAMPGGDWAWPWVGLFGVVAGVGLLGTLAWATSLSVALVRTLEAAVTAAHTHALAAERGNFRAAMDEGSPGAPQTL